MNWTADQQKAIQQIQKWLNLKNRSDEDRFYTLSGAAGTGKSTVVQDILKLMHPKRVCVSAPTHKAKEVISKMTGKEGMTLHSLLGLRPNIDLENFDPANPAYRSTAEPLINMYDIVIIDECSMVNKELYNTLEQKAIDYKKLILYVGDMYQLPPVNEKISKAFLVANKSVLSEVVRQKQSNPNQQVLLDARIDAEHQSDIIPDMFSEIKENINHNNDDLKQQGYKIISNQEVFYDNLIELYSDSEAKENMNYIKTLAYTNQAVGQLNKYIKNRINPSKDIIAEGDFLLGYNTMLNNAGNIIIQNSSDYYIRFLTTIEVKISMRVYKFYRVTVNKTGKTIDILHPDSYLQFQEQIERLYDDAISRRAWRPFYKFKEQIAVMQPFYHSSARDRFGNPQLLCKKDIDLGYAITVHKSQGSTYDNVAVIYNNFRFCRDMKERKKLTYVALSRTRLLNLIYI